VFFNEDSDRQNALYRVARVQQTHVIEFVGICLPQLSGPYRRNPFPAVASTHVIPANNQNARPSRAPYLIHWDVNNTPVYYRINWNEHLTLRCGWVLQLNLVLNELT